MVRARKGLSSGPSSPRYGSRTYGRADVRAILEEELDRSVKVGAEVLTRGRGRKLPAGSSRLPSSARTRRWCPSFVSKHLAR
jgi:hypothetical protein